MKFLQHPRPKIGFSAHWLMLVAVSILVGGMLHVVPALAHSEFNATMERDVDCGSGLHLRRATGVPSATVHAYAFGGVCNFRDIFSPDGPEVVGAPPLVASAHWDQSSETYTESLHLLAPTNIDGVDVSTYPEVARFKCDADPVINAGAHCTLISQTDNSGWHSDSGWENGGDQIDGFAWKANHNRPELLGLATQAQAAALSRTSKLPYISCTGLKLTHASGVPGSSTHRYHFDGTCELYHTADGSGGLKLTLVSVSGAWFANGQQAQESFYVLVPASEGGGLYKNADYTCSADPWLHKNVQCSLEQPVDKVPPVYDPISDLRANHPITAGMVNLAQATQLSEAHSSQQKPSVKLHESVAGFNSTFSASRHAHIPTPALVYSMNHHRNGLNTVSINSSRQPHVPTPKVTVYNRQFGEKNATGNHNNAIRFGAKVMHRSALNTALPAVQQQALSRENIRFGGKGFAGRTPSSNAPSMHTLSGHFPASTHPKHYAPLETYRSRRHSSVPQLKLLRQQVMSARGCTNLSRLITIHQTLYNAGGPLTAGQAQVFVQERGGAYIQSRHINVPALAHDARTTVTFSAGTRGAYRAKVPGMHRLIVSLTQNGKTSTYPLMTRLPADLCQPVRHQMHVIRERPVSRKGKVTLKLNPQPEPPSRR